MRILNTEEKKEINSVYGIGPVSLIEVLIDNTAKAQHQQDLKDFIEWLEERKFYHPRQKGDNFQVSVSVQDIESLKQLVE